MLGLSAILPLAISLATPTPHDNGRDNSTCVIVKTNAIPWALAVMNIEGEIAISEKFSLSVPVLWSPWSVSSNKGIKLIAVQPEGRWWLSHAGVGHFFGLHFSLASYNIRYGNIRYQDAGRPALGGGITYGYALHLNKSLGLEFSIGGGYITTRYDRFHNCHNGALIDTRVTGYWGIDHASVSLSYTFHI